MHAGPKLLHEVRKACAWYAKGLHGCNGLRQRIWKIGEPEAVVAEVETFFAELLDYEARKSAAA